MWVSVFISKKKNSTIQLLRFEKQTSQIETKYDYVGCYFVDYLFQNDFG